MSYETLISHTDSEHLHGPEGGIWPPVSGNAIDLVGGSDWEEPAATLFAEGGKLFGYASTAGLKAGSHHDLGGGR